MENNRVRLRERAVIPELYNRDLPSRVHRQESGSPAFALEDIDFDPPIGDSKKIGRPFYFQAVPRDGISKYLQHHCNFPSFGRTPFRKAIPNAEVLTGPQRRHREAL
jgi:hypothetical protein